MPDIEYYTGAYTGEEIDEYLGKAKNGSNPNLLDNGYFVGGGTGGHFPVNQRGLTSYSGAGKKIDRWGFGSTGGSLEVVQAGCRFSVTSNYQSFNQSIGVDPLCLLGKTVTISLLTADGTLYSKTGTLPTVAPTQTETYFSVVIPSVGDFAFGYAGSTQRFTCSINHNATSTTYVTVAAIKAEIGDTQTLAHQENGVWVLTAIPNYAEELLKCQRYLFLLPRYNTTRATAVRSDHVYFSIPIPVQLAKQPTLINESYLSVQAVTGGVTSGFTFAVSQFAGNFILIDASKTSHGLSDAVLSYGTTAPGVFLSAEL